MNTAYVLVPSADADKITKHGLSPFAPGNASDMLLGVYLLADVEPQKVEDLINKYFNNIPVSLLEINSGKTNFNSIPAQYPFDFMVWAGIPKGRITILQNDL